MLRVAIFKDVGLLLRNPLNKPIVAYSLVAALATALGAYRGNVDPASGFFFVAKLIEYFVLFMVIANYMQRRQEVNMVTNLHLVTFGLICAYGIFQILTGGDVSAPFEGSAGERNTLGGYLAMMGCVAGGILLYSESKLERRLLLALVAASFAVLLFSMSRSGWVAGFIGAVVLFFKAREKKVFLLMICLLLLVFPFIVPDAAVERFDFTFGQTMHPGMQVEILGVRLDTSSSARIQSWFFAFRRIPEHLLLGYGITGFSFLDGQFVRVLAETGILGLCAFLWLLWQTHGLIRQGLKCEGLSSRETGMLVGLQAGFWALVVHSLTTNSFIIIRIAEPFWCLAGLTAVIVSHQQEGTNVTPFARCEA